MTIFNFFKILRKKEVGNAHLNNNNNNNNNNKAFQKEGFCSDAI